MKKVLVVDDEKSIVNGLKFSLEQDDMEVDTAFDGEEALDIIRDNYISKSSWNNKKEVYRDTDENFEIDL